MLALARSLCLSLSLCGGDVQPIMGGDCEPGFSSLLRVFRGQSASSTAGLGPAFTSAGGRGSRKTDSFLTSHSVHGGHGCPSQSLCPCTLSKSRDNPFDQWSGRLLRVGIRVPNSSWDDLGFYLPVRLTLGDPVQKKALTFWWSLQYFTDQFPL